MAHLRSTLLSTCLAAVALTSLLGCPDREVSAVDPKQDKVEGKLIPVKINREVDILFVIDNSGSMGEEQASLVKNFSRFVDVLRSIQGGLPDVHIGIVSSDMGASGNTSAIACGGGNAGRGDNGMMRTPGNMPYSDGSRFITDTLAADGSRTKNYTGDLATVFSQAASLGTNGCGFEQHLSSATAALDNPINNGFIRPDAFLAIIIIGDEDDCSMPDGALLKDDPSIGSKGGVTASFRCTKYGVICDGPDNMDAVGPRTNCRPRDNSQYLSKVSDFVAKVKAKKGANADRKIIVAGITAPPEPFSVGRKPDSANGNQPAPALDPSCTYSNPQGGTQTAAPGVRLAAFISSFRNNSQTTICKDDLSDALYQIGILLKSVIGTPCFDAALKEPVNCVVTDYTNYGEANQTEKLMAQCNDAKSNTPCWHIDTNVAQCPAPATGKLIVFERGGMQPANGTVTKVDCETVE